MLAGGLGRYADCEAVVNSEDVLVTRIYCTEADSQLKPLLHQLKEAGVVGVTVFRGIAGFGPSGQMHLSNLLDVSLDLPLVVEFFDTPDKVEAVLGGLAPKLKPGHVLTWRANRNID